MNERDYKKVGFSSYIYANAEYYKHIVEDFYNTTAATHTEEEYRKALMKVCSGYMKEFTNEEVQRFLLESGLIESEDLAAIQRFYIEHAQPFQKAVFAAEMQEGKHYTLVYMNEFGFPVADKITFVKAYPCQYAQYTDAVKIAFKRIRKRNFTARYFYDCSLAIYEGWCDLMKESTYIKTKDTDMVRCYMSKYSCFDSRYFTDAIKQLGKPLMEYRNFKIGTNGKEYA